MTTHTTKDPAKLVRRELGSRSRQLGLFVLEHLEAEELLESALQA